MTALLGSVEHLAGTNTYNAIPIDEPYDFEPDWSRVPAACRGSGLPWLLLVDHPIRRRWSRSPSPPNRLAGIRPRSTHLAVA